MPAHTAHSLLDLPKHQGLRLRLVDELRSKGIRDQAVLKAIMEVPRHFFLDQALAELAYQDKAMPIGEGQTISQPYTVAFQSELLAVEPHMKILEIGTGSGYQACILDQMGARVFSVETIKSLHRSSQLLLKHLKCRAKLFVGDGSLGLPSYAPFDRILVTAASPHIPEALQHQVRTGGHLVIPVGELSEQTMLKLTKISSTEWRQEAFPGFRFVPLTGEDGWSV
ncbi:MAG: protein-L-isoaspartate(D-aspartate) O-methyltransferase [Cytophagia bacterium]|nr:protein-L-isoaspartate(D-aspartate) O-methyltransferase [Cytophagia bacterium]